MLIRNIQHLHLHPDFNLALVPRNAHHAETRLELDPLVDAAVRHERVPRLVTVLLRRGRIHVGDLAPRAAGDDVDVERLLLGGGRGW